MKVVTLEAAKVGTAKLLPIAVATVPDDEESVNVTEGSVLKITPLEPHAAVVWLVIPSRNHPFAVICARSVLLVVSPVEKAMQAGAAVPLDGVPSTVIWTEAVFLNAVPS